MMCALRHVMRSLAIPLRRFSTSAPTNTLNVGVAGAGNIGRAVCLGLVKNGYKVKVQDPNTTHAAELVERGVKWCDSPLEVCEGVDVLVTAVPAAPDVVRVMVEQGLMDNMPDGACWIDHTTSDKDETIRLAERAEARGLTMLEAPLTGGLELLKAGQMTALIGGKEHVLKKYKPLIECYTETILHMGSVGSAAVVKVLTNLLAGAHLILASEAVVLAKRHGVNLQAFFDGVRASAGNSYVFETEVPLIFNGTFDPGFTMALHNKDYRLGRQLAFEAKVPVELIGLSEQIYLRAMYKYGEKAGSSSPARLLPDDLDENVSVDGYESWSYEIQKVDGGGIAVVHKGVKKSDQ